VNRNHEDEDNIQSSVRLLLASASPRRAELLRAAGIEFDVLPAHVDESARSDETPDAYVRRLAREKAVAVLPSAQERLAVGADTAVVLDHEILGKPTGRVDGERMLRQLAGRTHQVITGVCVAGTSGLCLTEVESTTVEVGALSDDEIHWYVETGEGMDKAGGYAIQGLASRFITGISGSYTNVVGLPVPLLCRMLKMAGVVSTGKALSTGPAKQVS
jgi:septum formation protein